MVPRLEESRSPMSLALLRVIASRSLPATFTDPAEIDQIRLLCAAGHVAAFLPALNAQNAFARVLTITQQGKKALSQEAPVNLPS